MVLAMGASLAGASPALARDAVPVKITAVPAADQARCDARKSRVSERIHAHEDVAKRHEAVFANAVEKLDKIIAEAKEAGADTAKLEANLASFKADAATIKADKAAVVAQMNAMVSAACSDSLDAWKADITKLQGLIAKLHTDVAAIKTLYLSKIKPDVQAIAAKVKADEDKTGDADDEEGEETEAPEAGEHE